MDIRTETKKFIDTPELDIIANAMMKTYWKFIQKVGLAVDPQQKDIDKLFEQATSGMCFNASTEMARFLIEEHRDSFESIIILTTHDTLENSPTKVEISKNEPHSYILIKDKKGIWYAASPANHNMKTKNNDQKTNKDNQYATTLFFDSDLSKVLEKIKSRDGYDFPSETDILLLLSQLPIPKIIDEKYMEILEIQQYKKKINSAINTAESIDSATAKLSNAKIIRE